MIKSTVKVIPILTLLVLFGTIISCKPNHSEKKTDTSIKNIAVFVPGVLAGSPTYEMMDRGTRRAAEENNVAVKTIEGGFNQADWSLKVQTLAAEKKYDLIVTSNPAMPEICRKVKAQFPSQRFLVLEGSPIKDDTIATFPFNHYELAYTLGYFAGLSTKEKDPENKTPKTGLIAGQKYPEMEKEIIPGFIKGFKSALPAGSVDIRVVGNWYDATKASDLAKEIFNSGAQVILTISGGANQGVLSAAKELNKKVLWYDTNGYSIAPETIIGSGEILEEKAAYEVVRDFIQQKIAYNFTKEGNLNNKYIRFIDDDPIFKQNVSLSIQEALQKEIKTIE